MISDMASSGKCSPSTCLVRGDLSERVIIKERFERKAGESCDVWGKNVASRGNISLSGV